MSKPSEPAASAVEPLATIKLEYPVVLRSGTTTELNFTRRIKGRDLGDDSASKLTLRAQMILICKLTGVGLEVLDEMDGADLMAALGVLADFLLRGQATGTASAAS